MSNNFESALSQISRKDWRKWKKKYLMINYNILDKVLDKIKEITGIEKFDDTKILIDTDDKLILDKLRFWLIQMNLVILL